MRALLRYSAVSPVACCIDHAPTHADVVVCLLPHPGRRAHPGPPPTPALTERAFPWRLRLRILLDVARGLTFTSVEALTESLGENAFFFHF
mmetsp:Transcript_10149/g.25425  ORF Transcript_10149/g.25425 Transcript_10149/m.25425 type:complete len:91 (+) Transcript_10149:556-828(+)